MWKFIGSILFGALVIVVIVIAIPIIIIAIFIEMLMGLFGIEVKNPDGTVVKSWTQDKASLGVAFLALPAVIMILFVAFWFVASKIFMMLEFLRNGHPILVIFGVIVPIIGICLFACGMARNK